MHPSSDVLSSKEICFHYFTKSKITRKSADNQKALAWNYSSANWFREETDIRNPFQIAQGEKVGTAVCILKCHVISRGRLYICHWWMTASAEWLHLWALFAASGSDPQCLLGLFLGRGCDASTQPPCCVSRAETPARVWGLLGACKQMWGLSVLV